MMARSFLRLGACFLLFFVAEGCGKSKEFAEARRSSYDSYEQGLTHFNSRDYPKSAELFSEAIQTGGLNADFYSSAATRLAVAYSTMNRLDEAHSLLEKLEAGAPNMDEVYAARSYILAKQGKAAESRAALAKARRLNPKVQEFKD